MNETKIDIAGAFATAPAPLDFIFGGFLAGSVGALVAPGATGKSFFALEAAMAVAASHSEADLLGLNPKHHGRVVYCAAEDPTDAIKHRLFAIGQNIKSVAAREEIAECLELYNVRGRMLDVMDEKQQGYIIKKCEGARLVVLDTLSRVHTLDENSNGQMSELISNLERISVQTGAAVLFLHHVSKAAAMNEQVGVQQSARGASSLIDNARWCGFVSKMTVNESLKLSTKYGDVQRKVDTDELHRFMKFGESKQNYSKSDDDVWLERLNGGVLKRVQMVDDEKVTTTSRANRAVVEEVDDEENW